MLKITAQNIPKECVTAHLVQDNSKIYSVIDQWTTFHISESD